MSCYRGKASPNQHTKLRLFADSAGFCQSPNCHRRLFLDTDSGNLHIAEMAHVFAANDNGPRANIELTEEERGAYENLILLCPFMPLRSSTRHPRIFRTTCWSNGSVAMLSGLPLSSARSSTGNRQAVRQAIEPALAENRLIFDEYGPDNEYRFDPESELAQVWQRKVRSRVLPNNRKVLAILDANRCHLRGQELTTLEQFRQHVDDMEARHLGEGVTTVGRRFPDGMPAILAESDNA